MYLFVLLVIFNVRGCSNFSSYQREIFDDNNKIISQSDSYSFRNRVGRTLGNESNIEFSFFTGMETIWKINASEKEDIRIEYNSSISEGDFKIVLITPENEVINIISQSGEGNKIIQLNKGSSRFKIIGRDAKGEIEIKIEGGENIKLSGY